MIIEQTKDLRIINRIKVIQKMLSDSNYSRARLCKETGLNKATISTIVKEWMDWGLIEETTLACSTGGRKPILLQIIKNSGYSISIDIQLKSFQVVIANLKNEISQTYTIPFVSKDFSENYDILCNKIDSIIASANTSRYGLVGISVCVRGVIDLEGLIRFIPALNWRNIDIYTLLKERYQVPIFVDNAGNLATIAELHTSSEYKDLVMISITDVISSGLVTNGKLIYGYHGFANSIGHHTINFKESEQCSCGKYGCLEQYCSHQAILREMKKRTRQELRGIDEFIVLAKKQDKHALAVLNQFVEALSIGLSNIIFFLDCELIILECELLTALPYLLSEIQKCIKLPITGTQEFKLSTLGDSGAILGASSLCTTEFFRRIAAQTPSEN